MLPRKEAEDTGRESVPNPWETLAILNQAVQIPVHFAIMPRIKPVLHHKNQSSSPHWPRS